MKVVHSRWAYGLLLLCAVPIVVLACGPFFRVAVFVHPHPTGYSELVAGKVGIVRASYSREQLFLVYRNLNGVPLNPTEASSLNNLASIGESVTAAEWIEARREVLQGGEMYPWETTRELADYAYFQNCTSDAFKTAASHLKELIAQQGAASPSVRRWIEAQDLVFKNCSGDAPIPSDPSSDLTSAERADRLYQIAAAHFYARQYDLAAAEFQAIARDDSSPWRDLGLLLSARCYLRKATVGSVADSPESQSSEIRQASMRRALELLQQVVADKSLGRVHASALRLISFAELRVDPDKQLQKLSTSLRKPSSDPQFAAHLDDYFHVLARTPAPDEFGEWIAAVDQPGSSSIERWKKNRDSKPWFVAALLAADGRSEAAPDLIAVALKESPQSPAFGMAQYHAARLRYERGELDLVRRQIDTLLSKSRAHLDASTIAAVTILRSRAAESLAAFSRLAALPPTGIDVPYSGPGHWTPCESAADRDSQGCTTLMIAPAAAAMMNRLPLSALLQLTSLNSAPMPLRRSAAQMAFERGVLLGKHDAAGSAARILSSQSRSDADVLRGYLDARDDNGRRFSAALAMLKWPGVTPSLSVGFLREAPMRELSNYRNNWWASALGPKTQSDDPIEYVAADDAPPRFLTHDERKAAEREHEALGKVESASIWLPRVVIAWAKASPDDPRVPEALHLAVKATRYGADTTGATPYSKEAFQILHRRYPRSPWTAKTKYYY